MWVRNPSTAKLGPLAQSSSGSNQGIGLDCSRVWARCWGNLLPSSLPWLLAGFSSLQIAGLRAWFLVSHSEASLSALSHGLSIGYWALSSSKWDSKKCSPGGRQNLYITSPRKWHPIASAVLSLSEASQHFRLPEMTTQPKTIYRFSATPIRIPKAFYTELE